VWRRLGEGGIGGGEEECVREYVLFCSVGLIVVCGKL
jgi:hypothetical protein